MDQKGAGLQGLPESYKSNGERLLEAIWEKALDEVKARCAKKSLTFNTQNSVPVAFTDLVAGARQAVERAEKKKFPFTPRLQNLLRLITRYQVSGDNFSIYSPDISRIAWAGLHYLIAFAVEEGRTRENLVNALDQIGNIIFRLERYPILFASSEVVPAASEFTQRMTEKLCHELSVLFAEIAYFLLDATSFFKPSTVKRYILASLQPFDVRFKKTLDQIRIQEANVIDLIGQYKYEYDILQGEYENGKWLKIADFSGQFQRLRQSHIEDTTEVWFLDQSKVRAWLEPDSLRGQDSNALWVYGSVGSGKSTLAAFIVEKLQLQSIPVVKVFCQRGEENKSDLISILRNIIFQLTEWNGNTDSQRRDCHRAIKHVRLAAKTIIAQSMAELYFIFREVQRIVGRFYCIIDGIDECTNPYKEQIDFFQTVLSVPAASGPKYMVFARHTPRLEDVARHGLKVLHIDFAVNKQPITNYVALRTAGSTTFASLPLNMKEKLRESLVNGSQGMLLWVSLMIAEFEQHPYLPLDRLPMPTKLSSLYVDIFRRVFESEAFCDAAARLLHFVLVAARPPKFVECILAITFMSTAIVGGQKEYRIGIHERLGQAVLEWGPLKALTPLLTAMPDGTISFVHTSLKDFFYDPRAQHELPLIPRPEDLHASVAVCLISYLSTDFPLDDRLDTAASLIREKYPLLEYADTQLVWHLIQTSSLDESQLGLVCEFFSSAYGWKWLCRLTRLFGLTRGHLLVMQGQLGKWLTKLPLQIRKLCERFHLDKFVTHLRMRGVRETEASGINHPTYIEAMQALASAYRDEGEWKEAETLELSILQAQRNCFGDDGLQTLIAMENLAITYHKQGRWVDAEDLQVYVLRSRTAILGGRNVDTLRAMENVALTYCDQGRLQEAESLQLEVLQERKRLFGNDHPDVISALNNLAKTYSIKGNLEEVITMDIQILASRRRILGESHPSVLNAMANLAITMRQIGKSEDAEQLEKDVMDHRRVVLGDDHPDTWRAIEIVATGYLDKKKWNEAQELGELLLRHQGWVLGSSDEKIVNTMEKLCTAYKEAGPAALRGQRVEELQLKILEYYRDRLGEEHETTMAAMANLAVTYKEQQRWARVEALQQTLVDLERERCPTSLRYVHAINDLSTSLSRLRKGEEAEGLLMEAVAVIKNLSGVPQDAELVQELSNIPRDAVIIDVLIALATRQLRTNRLVEALKTASQARAIAHRNRDMPRRYRCLMLCIQARKKAVIETSKKSDVFAEKISHIPDSVGFFLEGLKQGPCLEEEVYSSATGEVIKSSEKFESATMPKRKRRRYFTRKSRKKQKKESQESSSSDSGSYCASDRSVDHSENEGFGNGVEGRY